MLTPNRFTGCALATLAIATLTPAGALAQEAAAPSGPKSGVASFSGASSTPAPPASPTPDASAPASPDAPPPAGENASAPANEPEAPSSTGAVRTYAAPKPDASADGAPRSATLYAANSGMRISIPHYTFEQVTRSILRLRMATFNRASVPALSASAPAAPPAETTPSPEAITPEPIPLTAVPSP